MGKRASNLVFIEHRKLGKLTHKTVGEVVVEIEQAAPMQGIQVGIRSVPKSIYRGAIAFHNLLFAITFGYNALDVRLFSDSIRKIGVAVSCFRKQFFLQAFVTIKNRLQFIDFIDRNAPIDMRFHILRRGSLGIVHITTDIAIVVLFGQRFLAHQTAVARYLFLVMIDEANLLDILGTQRVLVFAFLVFAVGIDEEHAFAIGGVGLVDNQQGGRDARTIEQSLRQSYDTFKDASRVDVAAHNEALAHFLFLATTEQHAVRHHNGHASIVFQNRNHVLHKHKVGLFLLAHPVLETLLELHVGRGVVLRKRRIGHHNVILVKRASSN